MSSIAPVLRSAFLRDEDRQIMATVARHILSIVEGTKAPQRHEPEVKVY